MLEEEVQIDESIGLEQGDGGLGGLWDVGEMGLPLAGGGQPLSSQNLTPGPQLNLRAPRGS